MKYGLKKKKDRVKNTKEKLKWHLKKSGKWKPGNNFFFPGNKFLKEIGKTNNQMVDLSPIYKQKGIVPIDLSLIIQLCVIHKKLTLNMILVC